MEDKNFIGNYGLFTTIVVAVLGMDIFSYPNKLTQIVGGDSWLITIINGLLNLLFLYLIYKVVKINKYENFYMILTKNLGKIFGSIIALIFALYTMFYISIGLRIFAEVIKMYLLHQTPTEFLIIAMIFSGLYLVRGEITSLVRFNELAFGVMAITLLIVFLFSLNNADFTNILPVFNNKPMDYLKGIKSTIWGFAGFQIAYVLLPFVQKKKKAPKIFIYSMIFITVIYILVCILSLAVFSKTQTKILLWPTMTMIKSIDIPGAFIERWEGIVMSIWVLFYFTTFSNSLYFSSDIVRSVFYLEDIKLSSLLIVPFIYLGAMYSENIAEVYKVSDNISSILYLINIVLLPVFLLIVSSLKRKGGKSSEF